ncbi:MAG: MBL fold metallo-hydrolase [Dehalococcoidia bacterium]
MDAKFEINDDIICKKYVAKPLQNNIWLIFSKSTYEAIVIDTPPDFLVIDKIVNKNNKLKINNIFITHNHYDHIDGIEYFYNKTNKPKVWIGQKDKIKMSEFKIIDKHINTYSCHESFKLNQTPIKFIETPGHTNGSTCMLVDNHVFTGDTLFPGGPGRTITNDDFKNIIESIKTKLLILPIKTIVHPGHGDDTKIQNSINEYNIFETKNPNIDNLSGNIAWNKNYE